MYRKSFKVFIVCALYFSFYIGLSAFQKQKAVTRDRAIVLAEKFIIDNGYTSLPADTSKLKRELFDRYENHVDSIIKRRHNTLQPKAFCINEDNDRWNVGFLNSTINVNTLDSHQLLSDLPGRAVIVKKNGNEVYLAHKSPLFSHFEKLW